MQEQENQPKEATTQERPKFDFAEHRQYLWTLTQNKCTEVEFSEALQNLLSEFQRAHAWVINKQLRILQDRARRRLEGMLTEKCQEKDSKLDVEQANQ